MDTQLSEWYKTELGRRMYVYEQDILDHILPGHFGYYLLKLGPRRLNYDLSASPIHNQIVLTPDIDYTNPLREVCVDVEDLPFENNSVDMVFYSHVLEFAEHPELIINEIVRVLIPEGQCIIFGFNPLSLWNLCRFFSREKNIPPWDDKAILMSRLRKQFYQLGCDVVFKKTFCFQLPYQKLSGGKTVLEHLGNRLWCHCGAGYVLVVKKTQSRLTPIKSKWHLRQKRIINGGAISSLNRGSCDS